MIYFLNNVAFRYFHSVLPFFFMHLWLCGQVSIRWGFREEIVLRAGKNAEGWINGFLLQTTSKNLKGFSFVSLLSFVDQFKTDSWFGFDFEMRILLKVVWKLKLPEALVPLVPLWASEASLLVLPPFWAHAWARWKCSLKCSGNIMNQLLLASLINRDVLLENNHMNKAAWANRINKCAQCGGPVHAWSTVSGTNPDDLVLMVSSTLLTSASYTVKHVCQGT